MTDAPTPPGWQPQAPMNSKSARAQAKASKAHAKALRPFWKKKRFLLPLALAVIIVIAVAASGGSKKKDNTPSANSGPATTGVQSLSDNGAHPPAADVVVNGCTYDATIGSLTANLTITNHSSGRSNYVVDISFVDKSNVKIGDGTAVSDNVEAGQVAKEDAVGVASGPAPSGLKCVVTSVNRFAS